MPSSSLKITLLKFTWINFTLYDSKNYIIQLKQILKYVNVQNLYKKETQKKQGKKNVLYLGFNTLLVQEYKVVPLHPPYMLYIYYSFFFLLNYYEFFFVDPSDLFKFCSRANLVVIYIKFQLVCK